MSSEMQYFWRWFSHLPPEQFIGAILFVGGLLICGFLWIVAWAEQK